jgi:hypothetical protein
MTLCVRHVKRIGIYTKISITDIINFMLLDNGTHVCKTKMTRFREMGGKIKCYLNAEKNKGKPMSIKNDVNAEIPFISWYYNMSNFHYHKT